MEWVESFGTLGNETMIIVDEIKVAGDIGFFGGLWKVLHSLNLFRKWLGASG